MIISNSLQMVGPTIDMFWVGKLGSVAIAAVGAAGMGMMVLMPAMMGLSMGARAMIARFIGAGDEASANHVARQAFVLSAGFCLIIALIGIFLAESILRLMGMAPDVILAGAPYMRIMFAGAVFMSVGITAQSIMQAAGDAVTPMKITVGTRLLHVVACPLLIFGWWVFPRMEVSGAAVSNIASQGVGVIIMSWVLFRGHTRIRLNMSNFRLDPGIIWRMVKIGIPALISGIVQPFAMTILMRIVASFGTLAVAAHTLTMRIQMLLFMPGAALGMAAGVLAGQNLGADQPERAEKSGWMAAGLVEIIMLIGSLVILLWSDNIVSIFNPDPALVEVTSTFLKISLVGYLVMGASMVFMQCLMGVGDTIPPMVLNIVMMWVVQLPLASILPRITNLGVYSVPWAMVIVMYVGAIFFTVYFRIGRWKRKKV
jgi:putative MATE family efflux protein